MYEWERDEPAIRRWLLGEASAVERLRIVRRAQMSRGYAEGVEVVEHDLVLDYVRGSLTRRDRERFGSKYLVTEERRRGLRFTEALVEYVDSKRRAA